MWRCIFATIIINKSLIFSSISAEVTLKIEPKDCRLLTAHKPDADVAYRPGVDVAGKAVAPADLPASSSSALARHLEDSISFQVILDDHNLTLRPPQGGGAANAGLTGEMILGIITVKDGRAMLDGVPLDGGSTDRLIAFCRTQGQGEK
tara:strand:- start:240 stop:686 length:447 start_codon:yes stop_codon:yes gene_type:complete